MLHFRSGYTQPADKVVDEDPYYYVQSGNRTTLVRKEYVAEITELKTKLYLTELAGNHSSSPLRTLADTATGQGKVGIGQPEQQVDAAMIQAKKQESSIRVKDITLADLVDANGIKHLNYGERVPLPVFNPSWPQTNEPTPPTTARGFGTAVGHAVARGGIGIAKSAAEPTNSGQSGTELKTHSYDTNIQWTFNTRDDFEISLPAGWVQIPKNVLNEYFKELQVLSPGLIKDYFDYDYGFQRNALTEGLSYPYILIQVKNSGRIPEAQLKSVSSVENAIQESIKGATKQASQSIQSMFTSSHIETGKSVYDSDLHIFWTQMESSVPGVGKVKAIIAMLLTERGVLNVLCYARSEEYEGYLPLFEKIVKGISFSETLRYKPQVTDSIPVVSSIHWDEIVPKAFSRGIAFSIIFLIISWLRRRKQKSKQTEQFQGQRGAEETVSEDTEDTCESVLERDRASRARAEQARRERAEKEQQEREERERAKRESAERERSQAGQSFDWCYTILGVSTTATLDEIDQAYRNKAKRHHPDHKGDHDIMVTLNDARDRLRALHRECN